MIAALLLPALIDPANNQLFLAMAMVLMTFSIKLLSIRSCPSSKKHVNATDLLEGVAHGTSFSRAV
jgi:hypothetical protein